MYLQGVDSVFDIVWNENKYGITTYADGRYGENPNRLGAYYQFQVLIKPSLENIQDLYLQSLEYLGLDLSSHDNRFCRR